MICPKGHNRECSIDSFRKHECKKCTNNEKLQSLVNKVTDKGYVFIKLPKHAKDIAIAHCLKGHVREAKIHNFLNFGCAECSGQNVPKNIEICKETFNNKGFVLLEDTYVNCKTKMRYICICGRTSETTMDSLINNNHEGCDGCRGERNSGEKASNWRGGIYPENSIARGRSIYRDWRTLVFKRDNYTCQCCDSTGGKLNAHHIENFSENTTLRYSPHNGITLCERCHLIGYTDSFHRYYGSSNNNIHQLQEYFDDTRSLLGLPPIDIIEDIIYKEYIFDIDENS